MKKFTAFLIGVFIMFFSTQNTVSATETTKHELQISVPDQVNGIISDMQGYDYPSLVAIMPPHIMAPKIHGYFAVWSIGSISNQYHESALLSNKATINSCGVHRLRNSK